jgi:hypothetical protein
MIAARRPRVLFLAFATLVAGFSMAPSPVSSLDAKPDFDGDGIGDLAVGVPYEGLAGQGRAGAVQVIHGGGSGLVAAGSELLSRDTVGVPGPVRRNDFFGSSLAWGDFDGDQATDLAVGIIRDGDDGQGGVAVFEGGETGLRGSGRIWTQDTPGIRGDAEPHELFGWSLASCDFDGDSYADLAIGSQADGFAGNPGGNLGTGGVNVIYGSENGLTALGDQYFTQDDPNIHGASNLGDGFGRALACGKFDGGPEDSLAIGIPFDLRSGAVVVLPGLPGGLGTMDSQYVWQGTPGIHEDPESGDAYGWTLSAGDFDGDAHDDLAVGVPGEWVTGVRESGAVSILQGSPTGISHLDDQFFHQAMPLIPDSAEANDRFGFVVVAGSFNGGKEADLAIGVPNEDLMGLEDVGAVHTLYGAPGGGLDTPGTQFIRQGAEGVGGTPARHDRFGLALSAGDFGLDAPWELAVGVPGDPAAGEPQAGTVQVFYGSDIVLSIDSDQRWSQATTGLSGTPERGDHFGRVLRSSDAMFTICSDFPCSRF